jgi:hypothetical protein
MLTKRTEWQESNSQCVRTSISSNLMCFLHEINWNECHRLNFPLLRMKFSLADWMIESNHKVLSRWLSTHVSNQRANTMAIFNRADQRSRKNERNQCSVYVLVDRHRAQFNANWIHLVRRSSLIRWHRYVRISSQLEFVLASVRWLCSIWWQFVLDSSQSYSPFVFFVT